MYAFDHNVINIMLIDSVNIDEISKNVCRLLKSDVMSFIYSKILA